VKTPAAGNVVAPLVPATTPGGLEGKCELSSLKLRVTSTEFAGFTKANPATFIVSRTLATIGGGVPPKRTMGAEVALRGEKTGLPAPFPTFTADRVGDTCTRSLWFTLPLETSTGMRTSSAGLPSVRYRLSWPSISFGDSLNGTPVSAKPLGAADNKPVGICCAVSRATVHKPAVLPLEGSQVKLTTHRFVSSIA